MSQVISRAWSCGRTNCADDVRFSTDQAQLIDQTYLPRDKAATTGTSATLFTNCSLDIKLCARSLSILLRVLSNANNLNLLLRGEGWFRQTLTKRGITLEFVLHNREMNVTFLQWNNEFLITQSMLDITSFFYLFPFFFSNEPIFPSQFGADTIPRSWQKKRSVIFFCCGIFSFALIYVYTYNGNHLMNFTTKRV